MYKKIVALIIAFATMLALSGCAEEEKNTAQGGGQKETETAFAQQRKAVPYPGSQLRNSLERENLTRKLLTENKSSAIGYVYLLSFGKFYGYYTIKGKVSSNQSQMTTDQLVIDRYEGDVVVNAPGDDGSYGPNEEGIFFFTNDGALVKTNSEYLFSNQPLSVADVPELNK